MKPIEIEIARNAATNGRWFCAALIFIGASSEVYSASLLAALAIGTGYLSDVFSLREWRASAGLTSLATVAVAASSFLTILANFW